MRLLIVCLTGLLSACSLTPEMTRPVPPIPATYPPHDHAQGLSSARLGWRTMFRDERLQTLIELAFVNNRDLRLAILNVEAVKAQYGIQRSAQLPHLDVTMSRSRQRSGTGSDNDSKAAEIQQQHRLSLGLSAFEIDLFGRMRSMSDAAFARYLASDYGRQAAQITLISAVADAYFAERLADEQLTLAKQTLTDWQQSLELIQMLRRGQQNSALDVAQAEAQVASAQASQAAKTRALDQARNSLRLLVGQSLPDDLPVPHKLAEQGVLTRLPAGLPSDLLLHRPDILQAEQILIAANEDIGAARAAYFPRLSLTSSVGYASSDIRNLVGSAHSMWSLMPQIELPIFQGGRLDAALQLAKVQRASAIAQYEKTIQLAFKQVADGLSGSETYQQQTAAQMRVVVATARKAQLSKRRYQAGVERRLVWLEAQRQLYDAKQTWLELRQQQLKNAVFLYQALGGGLVASSAALAP
ncbi:efflux transporter outer membrane subunit [Vibrio rhizosphaerae]|uniref:Efflux transporter outer membrane subunit n=1 Tax=Vibrio rhizosphaerae TaxID=398736 RepID=A0ABU4IT48_9VIBR|nr:efflux transporter outer membrane subunit [Vibrio rhizosphaerae]MDW6092123.1 efflux transporter outer membrane subunit [Vibrio rhizosphaerae]